LKEGEMLTIVIKWLQKR